MLDLGEVATDLIGQLNPEKKESHKWRYFKDFNDEKYDEGKRFKLIVDQAKLLKKCIENFSSEKVPLDLVALIRKLRFIAIRDSCLFEMPLKKLFKTLVTLIENAMEFYKEGVPLALEEFV